MSYRKRRYRKSRARRGYRKKRYRKTYRRRRYIPYRPEFKSSDEYHANAGITRAGTFYLLNGLTKGNERDERNGRQVVNKVLQARIEVNLDQEVEDTVQTRILLVQDRQPNGSVFGINDLLQDNIRITSFYRTGWSQRFRVLFDKTVWVKTEFPVRRLNIYKKVNTVTKFGSGDAGTVSDITTNSYYIVLFTDFADVLLHTDVNTRYRFLDS